MIQDPGLNTVCANPRITDSILLRCHRAVWDRQRENLLMDVCQEPCHPARSHVTLPGGGTILQPGYPAKRW